MKRPGALMLMALAAPGLAAAPQSQAPMQVSAVVVPRAQLEAIDAASQLTVTAEDVARGYKEVVARYEVRSNDPRGCLLMITPRLGLTESIDIEGLPSGVTLRDAPVELVLPGARGPQPMQLRVRLNLGDAARPGTYELPLHLAVSVL